ncbi:MAG: aldo/keto reductase [Clostridia bacterium]|nr:aldo/keto reductase [Clostridia bacterium]
MIYHPFQDCNVSALGLGCMRLPTVGDQIDTEAAAKMVEEALAEGVNYFDTAWVYHGGTSESVMGSLLSRYPRESYYLATKFPGFNNENMERAAEIFEEQLRRCQTDYFDFYLFHNLNEKNADAYLSEKYGILPYLLEQKKRGRIRHLGVSVHAKLETLVHFLDACNGAIEFCQIQLNWLDYDYQDAKAKVALLNERGIPIWVMEPVRGGALCKLAPKFEQRLRGLAPERSMAEWGFRYLQGIEGVTVTLSGMSNPEQLRENMAIFSEKKPLTEAETAVLYEIAHEMTHGNTLPCTACRYCVDDCPQGLDIPYLISLYNAASYTKGGYIAPEETDALAEEKRPSACIGCRACEALCPQGIEISKMMEDFTSRMK